MDFLNRAFAQLADLFRSMTPGARITAGLLLGVVVVSLAYLFNAQAAGPDSYLLGGHSFAPGELPAVQAAFGSAGLNDFDVEGTLIRIPRNKQEKYLAALADAGALPAAFGDSLMNIIKDQSPFASKSQQQEVIKAFRQKWLAKAISSMSGIASAEVFIDAQEKRGLSQPAVMTASVHVKTSGSQPLDKQQVRGIRSLIAGAVAGLPRDKVNVVESSGRHWAGDGAGGAAGGLDDPYLDRKLTYEENYKQEIQALLSYVPGVTVSVNVELNPEKGHTDETQKFDPKVVAVRVTQEDSETSTDSGGAGGRPGLEAQRPNQGAQLVSAGRPTSSKETQSTVDTTNLASTEIRRSETVGLTPDKVTVSIVVPTTYFEDLWRRRNPPAAGQPPRAPTVTDLGPIEEAERLKIQSLVLPLIPHDAAAPGGDLVAVTAFTPVPMPDIPAPSMPAQTLDWLSNSWTTVGMFALVLVSLMMLRSMVRSAAPAPVPERVSRPAARPALVDEAAPEPAAPESKVPRRLRRRIGAGPSLRDDLVELVREDPDAAANILRGWIGNVS